MDFDHILLSRLQFAFTVAFHIIFPAFTIGLASYLAVLEGLWLTTKREVFRNLYMFWVKVFALAFGMGVVSGVVMSYQFGTNWSVFADMTGNVLGPLLGYEVLTAFFLEASFLGIMLFGWNRVGPKLHFTATMAVAVGTLISAFWILSANSWMQTPTGHAMEDGRFIAVDWMQVIFNPSFPSRFAHMTAAAYLTTALVVLATASWQALKGRDSAEVKTMRRMAVLLLAIMAPAQLLLGHESGSVALEHQPAKVAAMEGWWESGQQTSILLGWPDDAAEKTHVLLETPVGWGSWVVAGRADAELQGLKAWAPEDRPPTLLPFWSFRIMVGLGLLMILQGGLGALLWWRGRIDSVRPFHWLGVAMGPAGFVAVLAGWIVTEVGRQPYVVYGALRTADAVSPVSTGAVATSLLAFMVAYAIVFSAGALYIGRLTMRGPVPDAQTPEPPPQMQGAPGSPLTAMASVPSTEGR